LSHRGLREGPIAEGHPLAIVVLAAGRGSRLSGSGDELPKWLVRVGGRSLADWQLDGLRRAAPFWSRLIVVTGHRAELFDAEALSAVAGRRCELLYNPQYAAYNNWYSLLVALEQLAGAGWEGSVCVVNSDLLLGARELQQFVESAARAKTSMLAVDVRNTHAEEEMKVAFDASGQQIVDIAKTGLEARPSGEFIGLSKIDAKDVTRLRRILESFVDDPTRASEWYEGAFRQAIREGAEFSVFPVDTGRWIEIDDQQDLGKAQELASRLREEH
jgi:choline kinase